MRTDIKNKKEQRSNEPQGRRTSIGFSESVWEVLPFVWSVFPVFILLRAYLFIASQRSPFFEGQELSEIWQGLFYDLWLLLLVWFVMALMNRFFLRMPRFKKAFSVFVLSVVIICAIAADQYFLISGQALDSTFFYFTWEEIWIISGIQDRLTIGMIASLVTIVLLVYCTFRWLNMGMGVYTWKGHRLLSTSVFLAFILSPFSVYMDAENETRQGMVNNRLLFFIHDGMSSLFRGKEDNRTVKLSEFQDLDPGFFGGEKSKGVYPLYRTLREDHGWENVFYKTSDGKPPHIVLVVVESMSSDFFGERAKNTGCLMPFLDSLCRRSMYYPNGFSTSQRTHNVLPAVLSSVPNVVDGNAFQQIAYPNHWGLPGLLKDYYYSRFYCGVSLEYLNMSGFFNYHNVDYLVNKWSKRNQRLNAEVDSPWGYPDGALFNQGVLETPSGGNIKGKRLMDVYLTISTHDPFIYPNKEYYSEMVRKKCTSVASEKHRKVLLNQAEGLGSFVYTDEQLRTFFQEWKKKKAYRNTIFIITGDHGSELYPINKLTKYNIPLLVFSPLLKKHRTIKQFVSHLDIPPTLISYLRDAYGLNVPVKTPFIGKVLPVSDQIKEKRVFMFMTNKLRSNELLYGKTAYLENNAYRVNKHLQLQKEPNSSIKRFLKRQINLYQLFSFYIINQNKLIPPSDHVKWYGASVWHKIASQIVPVKSIDRKKKLNYLGTFNAHSALLGKMKIQLRLHITCSKKSDFNNLPDLVISDRTLKWLKKEWMLFKAVRPVLLEKFRTGKSMKVAYTLEFDSGKMPYFKQQKSFCFMWNNADFKTFPKVSNLEWLVYTKKTR